MREKHIAKIIERLRKRQGLVQNEFGERYGVSGPAIFKFEKGFITPSLKLWLPMAQDVGLDERRAVVLWVKDKLPEPYQQHVDLLSAATPAGKGSAGRPRILSTQERSYAENQVDCEEQRRYR